MSDQEFHNKRTLEQVLAMFIGALLLTLLLGSFMVNVYNLRNYLEQQLQQLQLSELWDSPLIQITVLQVQLT